MTRRFGETVTRRVIDKVISASPIPRFSASDIKIEEECV